MHESWRAGRHGHPPPPSPPLPPRLGGDLASLGEKCESIEAHANRGLFAALCELAMVEHKVSVPFDVCDVRCVLPTLSAVLCARRLQTRVVGGGRPDFPKRVGCSPEAPRTPVMEFFGGHADIEEWEATADGGFQLVMPSEPPAAAPQGAIITVSTETELRDALANGDIRNIHIATTIVLAEVEQLDYFAGTVRPLRVFERNVRLSASVDAAIDARACKDNKYACAGVCLDISAGGRVALEGVTFLGYGVNISNRAFVTASNCSVGCSVNDECATPYSVSGDSTLEVEGGSVSGVSDPLLYVGGNESQLRCSDVAISCSGRHANGHAVTASGRATADLIGCAFSGPWGQPCFEEEGGVITLSDCTFEATEQPPPTDGGDADEPAVSGAPTATGVGKKADKKGAGGKKGGRKAGGGAKAKKGSESKRVNASARG